MTQNEKDLLLKDLCARLPYEVKFRYKYIDGLFREKYGISTLTGVRLPYYIEHHTRCGNEYLKIEKDEIKPYLFPLSSMTEEQYYEMQTISGKDCLEHMEVEKEWKNNSSFSHLPLYEHRVIDFFDKNHFDYRGLIPMGLAIDATGKNIY